VLGYSAGSRGYRSVRDGTCPYPTEHGQSHGQSLCRGPIERIAWPPLRMRHGSSKRGKATGEPPISGRMRSTSARNSDSSPGRRDRSTGPLQEARRSPPGRGGRPSPGGEPTPDLSCASGQGTPGLPAVAACARRSITRIQSSSLRRWPGRSGSSVASSSATIRARSSGASFRASSSSRSTVLAMRSGTRILRHSARLQRSPTVATESVGARETNCRATAHMSPARPRLSQFIPDLRGPTGLTPPDGWLARGSVPCRGSTGRSLGRSLVWRSCAEVIRRRAAVASPDRPSGISHNRRRPPSHRRSTEPRPR
jgi:hypothetical protein